MCELLAAGYRTITYCAEDSFPVHDTLHLGIPVLRTCLAGRQDCAG